MTFQEPFLSSNGRNYPEKKVMKCTMIYPASLGLRHMCEYDQFINKTHVEGVQTICLFPYCYLFKDRCQKTHDNHIRKISNFFKLVFFNDFHWFSMTFPGKISFFQANIKFHDFSRLVWTMFHFMLFGIYSYWSGLVAHAQTRLIKILSSLLCEGSTKVEFVLVTLTALAQNNLSVGANQHKYWNQQSFGLRADSTGKCRYNAVQYNMILHTPLQWLGQNIHQSFNPQKTPHISP